MERTDGREEIPAQRESGWLPQRAAAVALALGTILFGLGSLLHPPTVRREDLMHVVRDGATPMWLADHWLLTLSTVLIVVGLAGFHAALAAHTDIRRGMAELAAPLGAASATSWIGLFVFEATGWPEIAAALVQSGAGGFAGASALLPVAQGLWSGVLGLGYAAGALFAVVIGLWSAGLLLSGETRTVGAAAWVGLVASGVGIVTMALAWMFSSLALYLLIPAALLLGLWLLLAAWRLWQCTV